MEYRLSREDEKEDSVELPVNNIFRKRSYEEDELYYEQDDKI